MYKLKLRNKENHSTSLYTMAGQWLRDEEDYIGIIIAASNDYGLSLEKRTKMLIDAFEYAFASGVIRAEQSSHKSPDSNALHLVDRRTGRKGLIKM